MGVLDSIKKSIFSTPDEKRNKKVKDALNTGSASSSSALKTSQAATEKTALKGTGSARSAIENTVNRMKEALPDPTKPTAQDLMENALEEAKQKIESGQVQPIGPAKSQPTFGTLKERLSQIVNEAKTGINDGTIDLAKVNTKDADSTFMQTVQAYNSEKQAESRTLFETTKPQQPESLGEIRDIGEPEPLEFDTVADSIRDATNQIKEAAGENPNAAIANRDLQGFSGRIGGEEKSAEIGDVSGGGGGLFGNKGSGTFDAGIGSVNPTLGTRTTTLDEALNAFLDPGVIRKAGNRVVRANKDGTSPKGLSVGDIVVANNEQRKIAKVNSDGTYTYEKNEGLSRIDRETLSSDDQQRVSGYQKMWKDSIDNIKKAKEQERTATDLLAQAQRRGRTDLYEDLQGAIDYYRQAQVQLQQQADTAHEYAEDIRRQYGYTAGSTGTGYNDSGNGRYNLDAAPGQASTASLHPERAFLQAMTGTRETPNARDTAYENKQNEIIRNARDAFGKYVASGRNDIDIKTDVGKLDMTNEMRRRGTVYSGNVVDPQAMVDNDAQRYMTDYQKQIYRYLYNAEGRKKADDYLEALSYERLNPTAATVESMEANTFAQNHPIAATLTSVATNQAASIAGLRNAMNVLTGDGDHYKPVDPNDRLNRMTQSGSTMRSNVRKQIEDIGGIAGKIGAFEYDMMTSGLDMAASTLLGGRFSPKAVTGILSTSSAQQTWMDSLNRGASQEEAALNAFANGAFEFISETPAVEGMFRIGRGGSPLKDIKTFVKNIGAEMGMEAGGEAFANVTQTAADQAIMGNRSDYAMTVQENMANGMTKEQAERAAFTDLYLKETARSAALGAALGGMMGGGGTAVNIHRANRQSVVGQTVGEDGRTIRNYSPIVQDIAKTAERMADDYGLPSKYTETARKILNGEKVGAVKLANLRGAIQEQSQILVKDDIENIYKYVGLTKKKGDTEVADVPDRLALSLGRFTGADESGFASKRFTDAWLRKSNEIRNKVQMILQYNPSVLTDPNSEVRQELAEYSNYADLLLFSGYLSEGGDTTNVVRALVNEQLYNVSASAATPNPISDDNDTIYEEPIGPEAAPETTAQETAAPETTAQETVTPEAAPEVTPETTPEETVEPQSTQERIEEAVAEEPTVEEATERVLAEEEQAEEQSVRTPKGQLEELAPEPTAQPTEPSVTAEDVAAEQETTPTTEEVTPQKTRTQKGTVEQVTPQQAVSNEAVNPTAEPTAPTTGEVARTEVTRAERSNAEASTETQSGAKNSINKGVHISQIESQPQSVRNAIREAENKVNNYLNDPAIIPPGGFTPRYKALVESIKDYDVVSYDRDTGTVTLYKTDDFNGKTEPRIIAKATSLPGTSELLIEPVSGEIIPNKSEYVPDNYTGFDVAEQRRRENYWREVSRVNGIRYDGSQLNNEAYFNQKFGDILQEYEQPVTEETEETAQAPENITDAIDNPEAQEIFNEDVNDRLMDEIEQVITDGVNAEAAEDSFYEVADQAVSELADGYNVQDPSENELIIDTTAQTALEQHENFPDDANFNPDKVNLTKAEKRKAIDIRKQIRSQFPGVAATGERNDSYAELLTAVQNVIKYAKTYNINTRASIPLNRYADDVFEDYMFRSFRDRADISEEEEIFCNEMKKQTLRYNDYYKEAFGPKESYDRRAGSFKYKPGAYMGFNAARKRVRGAIELSQSRGTYADQLWEELKDLCPGMFPYEDVVNPQDQFRMILDRLGDIRDKMRDGIPFNETEAYEREGEDSVFYWVWDMTEITVNGLIRENTKGAQQNGRRKEAQEGRDQSESRPVSERTSGESGRDRAEDQGNVRPESKGEQLAQEGENGNEITEGQVDISTGRETVSDQSQNQQNNEVSLTPKERAQETARNASAKRRAENKHKTEQFEILQNSNPMRDDIHTGIRSVNDIKTAQEVFGDEDEFIGTPDWTFRDAQFALENGTVTIYSSNAIVDGAFVTPSKMIAQDYAGANRDVNSTVVSLDDVAWIDSNEGQYAPINTDSQQDVIVEETAEEETGTKEFQFVPWQWYNVSVRNTKNGKVDDLGTMTSYNTQKQIEGYTYNGSTFEDPRDLDYVYVVEPAEWTDQQKPLIEKYGEFNPDNMTLTPEQEERAEVAYLYMLSHPVATMVNQSDEQAVTEAIRDIEKFAEHIENSNRIALKQYANKRMAEFLSESDILHDDIQKHGLEVVQAMATDYADEALMILNESEESFEDTKRYVGMSEAAEQEQNEPPARLENRTVSQQDESQGKKREREFIKLLESPETENILSDMEPVSNLTGKEFQKDGSGKLIDRVEKFIIDGGYSTVINPDLGPVIINRKGIKSSLGHGIGSKKAAAFAAIPDVIRNGRIIYTKEFYKNRPYTRHTIAAPITIDGKLYYMGVALNQNVTTNFFLHEVTEKGDASFKTIAARNQDSRHYGDAPPLSENIIPQTETGEQAETAAKEEPEILQNRSVQPYDTESAKWPEQKRKIVRDVKQHNAQSAPIQQPTSNKNIPAGYELGNFTNQNPKQDYGKTLEARRSVTKKQIKNAKNGNGIQSIRNAISDKFDVTVSLHGKGRMGYGTEGFYDTRHKVIHTKPNALGIAIHEFGHHMDDLGYDFNNTEAIQNILNNAPNLKNNLRQYSPNLRPYEVVAEFVWQYVSNPDGAYEMGSHAIGGNVSENFYDTFENTLSEEDLQKLKDIRSMVFAFYDDGVSNVERFKSSIKTKKEAQKEQRRERGVREWIDDKRQYVAVRIVDYTMPLAKMMNRMETETGKKLSKKDRLDVSMAMAGSCGTMAETLVAEGGGMITPDYTFNNNFTSFGDIFASMEKDMSKIDPKWFKDFEAYLKAKHSIDWEKAGKKTISRELFNDLATENKGGPDLAADNAIEYLEGIIRDLEQKYGDTFKKNSEILYNWWDQFMRTWAVDTGLVDPEVYEIAHAANPHYIPMMRVMEDGRMEGAGKGRKDFLIRAKGSVRSTYSPIESMVGMIGNIVNAHYRNQFGQNIARLYESNDEDIRSFMSTYFKEVDPKQHTNRVNMHEMKDELEKQLIKNAEKNLTPSERVAMSKMGQRERWMFLADKAGVNLVDSIIGNTVVQYEDSWFGLGKDVVVVDYNGQTRAFKMLDKNMAHALKALDGSDHETAFKLIGRFTRGFSYLTTAGNPIFAVSNAVRDYQHAFITDGDIKYIGRWGKALGESFYNEFRGLTGKEQQEEYKKAKAMMGFGSKYYIGSDAYNNYLEDIGVGKMGTNALTTGGKAAYRGFKGIVKFFEAFNGSVEMAPRLAAYKKAYNANAGLDFEERNLIASQAARNVTVDFNKRGTATKNLGKVIPFLGAGIAGINQAQQIIFSKESWTTKEGRARLVRALVSQSLPAILLSLLYGGDDDEDKEYQEMSNYMRHNYWVFKVGDTWIRLPKDRELAAIFSSTIQDGFMAGMFPDIDKSDLTIEYLGYLAQQWMPPHEFTGMAILDAMNNKTWYGTELISDFAQGKQFTPGFYQNITDDDTSSIANWIANFIYDPSIGPINPYSPDPVTNPNRITGAIQKKLGALATPIGIDYVLDQMGGGLADVILPITRPSEGAAGVLAMLTDRFTTNPKKSNKYSTEAYEIRDRLDAALEKDGDNVDDFTAAWADAFSNSMNTTSSNAKDHDFMTVGDYHKEIREISHDTSIPLKERREMINERYDKIAEITQNLVTEYHKAVKTKAMPTQTTYAKVIVPDAAKALGIDEKTYAESYNLVNSNIKATDSDSKLSKQLAIASADIPDNAKQFFSQKHLEMDYDSWKDEVQGYLDKGVDFNTLNEFNKKAKEAGYKTTAQKALFLMESDYSEESKKAMMSVLTQNPEDDSLNEVMATYQNALDSGASAATVLDFDTKLKSKNVSTEGKNYREKALLAIESGYGDSEGAILNMIMADSDTSPKYHDTYVQTFRKAAELGITVEDWRRVEEAIQAETASRGSTKYSRQDVINGVAACGYTGEKALALKQMKSYKMFKNG